MNDPTNTAKIKEPHQLGQELASALAEVLANRKDFIDSVHDAKPLFFRGVVTATRTSGGMNQVQVKRTGQLSADATWYPVYDAGYYAATVGDDVLLVYTDRKMSACVIGARTVAVLPRTPAMVWDRTWSSAVAYKVGDTVFYSGTSYVCVADNTNNPPALATGDGDIINTSYTQLSGVPSDFGNVDWFTSGAGLLKIRWHSGRNNTFISLDGVQTFFGGSSEADINYTIPLDATNHTVNLDNDFGGGGWNFTVTGQPNQSITITRGAYSITVSPATDWDIMTTAVSNYTTSANFVLAGPTSGSPSAPTFRALVSSDIPNLDASKITSGTLSLSRLSGITTTQLSATAGITSGQIASVAASTITGTLATARGGTGLDSSGATNGQLLIGTGTGLALSTLTAGTGVTITNASGSITINAVGGSGGVGTVTSVALTAPSEISVAGSPITTSGTLALTWATESANLVFAGPTTGVAATPGFRSLVSADIPNLDAGKITTGTLALARGGTATDNSAVAINQVWAGPSSGATGSALYRALVAADIPNLDAGKITTGLLATASGGTGVNSSAAGNGQLLIGTGTGLALANLTAGSNITITNASGSITIASTGGGGASPLTTKGDIYGHSTVDARVPVGADGTFLAADSSQATGLNYKFPAGIAGVSTLSSALSADVTLVNANTYYDGPSLSLTAGTWLLIGNVTIDSTAGVSNTVASFKLWDGTTTYDSAEQNLASNANYSTVALHAIVSPTTTTTYKVSAAYQGGGSAASLRAQLVANAAGNTASTLQAIQLTGAPASGPGALMPAVRCYRSTNQSISGSTWTAVTLDTNVYDQGTSTIQHSTTSNTSRLTCQQAGVYNIGGTFQWNAASSSDGIRVYLNGTTIIDEQFFDVSSGHVLDINTHYKLNVGDYVELYAYSQGANTLITTGDINPTFWMARVDSGPGAVQPNTKVQLDYALASDVNSLSVTSNTWTDFLTNQTFTVDDANSIIEVAVSGYAAANNSAAINWSARIVIDSAGTPINKIISGARCPANDYTNLLAGCDTIPISGLSAGSHTVKLQVFSQGANGTVICQPALSPNTFSASIRVLERKQSSSPISSTPAPAVRCYNSGAISLTNGSWTTLTFDTNVYDRGTSTSQHSVSSNTSRLTCQQAGIYDIGAVMQLNTNPSSAQLQIFLNGTTSIGQEYVLNSSPGIVSTSCQYNLNVGDYVEARAWTNSASISALVTGDIKPSFWMARVDSGGQGFVPIPMVKTSSYTILNTDCMVVAGANSLTFTLPTAASRAPGMPIVVKNDNFTGTTIARASTDTIDGATSYSLTNAYSSVTLVGDGVGVWRII